MAGTVESGTEMKTLGSGGSDGGGGTESENTEGLTLLLTVRGREIFFKGHLTLHPSLKDQAHRSQARFVANAFLNKSEEILDQESCVLELRLGLRDSLSLPIRAALEHRHAQEAESFLRQKEESLVRKAQPPTSG